MAYLTRQIRPLEFRQIGWEGTVSRLGVWVWRLFFYGGLFQTLPTGLLLISAGYYASGFGSLAGTAFAALIFLLILRFFATPPSDASEDTS